MSVKTDRTLRKTELFEAALCAIADYADVPAFESRGGLCACDRLDALVRDLTRAYDAYELNADIAPARQAAESYQVDLADAGIAPDPWIWARLSRLLADIEADETILTVRVPSPPPVATIWPDSVMTVHPDALAALLEQKRREGASS